MPSQTDSAGKMAGGAGPPKQMGPALLPTPLLPVRGHFLVRRPSDELGTRCFPVLPPKRNSSSVTGARTGIRFRARLGPFASRPKPFRAGFRRFPTPGPFQPSGRCLERYEDLAISHPFGFDRSSRPMSILRSRSFHRLASRPAGAFHNADLQDRADSDRHVGSGPKFRFDPVRRPFRSGFSLPFR